MKNVDAVVVGGGVLGAFAARELTRYELSVLLLEKCADVCTGITKANTAIIYPGYDHKPGTLKARLTLRANSAAEELCAQLGVPFSRCGSLMVSYGEKADEVLKVKYDNGRLIGVPGLRLISGAEAQELEPSLAQGVSTAIFAPTTATVDPWELCYAAFENARANGCEYRPGTELLGIRKENDAYILLTDGGEIRTKAVVNCAGLCADRVHEMLFPPTVRIRVDAADYYLLDRGSARLTKVIFHETEERRKGITAVPTTGGSILVGPAERELAGEIGAVSSEGLASLHTLAASVLPGLSGGEVIRSFAAVRPNPYGVVIRNGELVSDGTSIGSFVIEQPEEGFISFIGIKTPGLTCARELGALAAEKISSALGKQERTDFDGERKAIARVRGADSETLSLLIKNDPDYGEIVCLCESISKAEVLDAIRRGAVTADGVKRRCGAMLGACQGSRCRSRIEELLASEELGVRS